MLKFIRNSHPGLVQAIREKKTLTPEITSDLELALKDFKELGKQSDIGIPPAPLQSETESAAEPAPVG